MAFQSYLGTHILPAAETALSATEAGRRLRRITAGHLAFPSTPALLPIQEGKAFGKPYSAASAQQLSSGRHRGFDTMAYRTLTAQDEILPLQRIRVCRWPQRGFVIKMLDTCKLVLVDLDTTGCSSTTQCQTSNRALGGCRTLKSSSWRQGPHLTAENHYSLQKRLNV